jgi:hypothetical protein
MQTVVTYLPDSGAYEMWPADSDGLAERGFGG